MGEDEEMYRESIITYFDVLGFKAMVRDKSPREVERALRYMLRISKPDAATAGDWEQEFRNFSDLVIRTVPLDSEANREDRVGIFFAELIDIVHAQANCAADGVLLRGSMTLGDIYVGETVYGPGLIKAYELESTVAKYPRIIVDPGLLTAFRREAALQQDGVDFKRQDREVRQVLKQDTDGVWFVDYLRAFMFSELDPPDDGAFIQQHSSIVRDLYEGCTRLDDIAVKAGWLANYHNTVVHELHGRWLAERGLKRADLLVKTDASKVFPA
jgi:hypothetical protein